MSSAPAADELRPLTVAVPHLSSFTSRSGLGRVLRSLQSAWGERALLVESEFRRLPLPLLRNIPYGVAPPAGADCVLLPQLSGAQALRRTGGLPSLAIVHDIGIVDFPGDRPGMDLVSYLATRHSFCGLRHATRIITASHFTHDRLLSYLPGLSGQVLPVQSGVSELFLSYAGDQATARKLLAAQAGQELGSPLLLYVGSELPRKHIGLLLQVLQQLRRRYPEAQLLKVGGAGHPRWRAATLATVRALGLEPGREIVLLEGIDDDLLAHSYRATDLFLTTSLYEGFGLPALEALAVGTPAVVTDRGALPEVVGDAGLIVAPDVDAFLQAIERALATGADNAARQARRDHARRFSWERAADQYLAVMRELGGLLCP